MLVLVLVLLVDMLLLLVGVPRLPRLMVVVVPDLARIMAVVVMDLLLVVPDMGRLHRVPIL